MSGELGGAGQPATIPAMWLTLLSLAVALVPLSFSSHLPGRSLPAAILFFSGLGVAWKTRRCWIAAAPVGLAMLGMLAFLISNALVHRAGWRPLDHAGHVLLFLVIAAVFGLPLRMRLVWAGFAATAIVLGTVCVVQHFAQGQLRAYGLNGGPSAAIQVATVLLGLGLLSLVQLLGARITRSERLLHAVAVGLAVYGALLTQSRGPLLAFIPMALVVVVLHVRRTGSRRGALWATAGVAVLLSVGAMQLDMMTRLEAAGHEVATFDPAHHPEGAVRERLEMWRAAGTALAEHPLAGIGPDNYTAFVHEQIAQGKSSPAIAPYNQPHNEYLRAGASGGLPGLIVVLLMFALPTGFFLRLAHDRDPALALPATAGLAVVGLYAMCALTDSVFYRVMSQSFYFFIVGATAVLAGRQLSLRSAATSRQPGPVAAEGALGAHGPGARLG